MLKQKQEISSKTDDQTLGSSILRKYLLMIFTTGKVNYLVVGNIYTDFAVIWKLYKITLMDINKRTCGCTQPLPIQNIFNCNV